jgi:hypothetical protein
MRKNILSIIATSLLLTSCNEKSKTHAFFIDVTASTSISKESDNTNDLLQSLRKMIDKKVLGGETIVIYPIHARTGSAASIFNDKMPLPVNLNWKTERENKLDKIVSDVNDKLFINSIIDQNIRSNSSIFPIFSKLKKVSKDGIIEVTIISDMIEYTSSMNFYEKLDNLNNNAVKQLAIQKYSESKDEFSIKNTNFSILIPGTEAGNKYTDDFNIKVYTFWETFFREAGAKVFISDLS